jgi:hypothetical protein
MNSSSKNEVKTLLAECDKQFVGRRKTGGGYTYYDFLQNRQFDIVGPNPSREELKYFDEQYTLYLEAQKREMDAAFSAEQKNQIVQPDLKDDPVVGSMSPPITRFGDRKSLTVHTMPTTQHLDALGRCATELVQRRARCGGSFFSRSFARYR